MQFLEVLHRWQTDPIFREFFIMLLAESPYVAFRWETPPITAASATRPFDLVLLDSPGLESQPDPDVFAVYFRSCSRGQEVVSFPNLHHDAMLLVPCPVGPLSAYGHLAAFVSNAPTSKSIPYGS